jgi:eukaryotic-like serine/threonine-protein kinase
VDPERWQQIEQLYSSALRRRPDQRATFLWEVCRDDSELRREVEELLAQVSDAQTTELSQYASAWQDTMTIQPTGSLTTASGSQLSAGQRLGPYRIEAMLGVGGMGQVYTAVDTRLGRKVAIKVSAEQFSGRFEREARAISALNHPHICTLYDVGALPSGSSYLVTELVEGETLREWLKRAPAVDRSIEIARQVLEALRAAHQAGIVHRDLKPANIMVRFDGYVKVLDFGLAKRIRPAAALSDEDTVTDLSVSGQIVGTIAYMSPEQIQGQETGPPSDLFALGIILHEMLTGAHPWPRKSPVDTLHAILHDDPPPLPTSAQMGLAAVVRKLLRKNPADRYSSAEAVLEALAARASSPAADPAEDRRPERALTKLIVLPFRLLRRHEASDFLAVSLPDAITSSLAAIDSLVVRSTLAASRFAGSELDLNAIAEQAQVNSILTGTILPDGERLRVSAQLVAAPSGTVLWSHSSQVSLSDIFQLQDELVDRIVQSLSLPLTDRERRALKHDVPASAIAYELYLRANQLALAGYDPRNMTLARDLYLRSVEEDSKYAPTWAGLGRIYRLIGKYAVGDLDENLARAEDAFQKAFALNPELALAHNFYTSLQTDLGRPLEALERLLKRAHEHRNDPNLLAGLVHACRYCGLLEASIAAHDRARQLDAQVRTTVAYAYFHRCDFERTITLCSGPGDMAIKTYSLLTLGRYQEASALLSELEKTAPATEQVMYYLASARALIQGDRDRGLAALQRSLDLPGPFVRDPEGHFYSGRDFSNFNEPDRALQFLSKALDGGFCCHYPLLHDPWFAALRSHGRFAELVDRAAALELQAKTVFLDNGGDRLLGVTLDLKPAEPDPSGRRGG